MDEALQAKIKRGAEEVAKELEKMGVADTMKEGCDKQFFTNEQFAHFDQATINTNNFAEICQTNNHLRVVVDEYGNIVSGSSTTVHACADVNPIPAPMLCEALNNKGRQPGS